MDDDNSEYEKCTGMKCSRCPGPKNKKRAAIHPFMEEGVKKGSCLVHILPHERDIFKASKYEHAILNSILGSLKDDQVEEVIHDKIIDSEYNLKQAFDKDIFISKNSIKPEINKTRPDLLIVGKNGSMVVVEIDEKQHFKNDEEKEKDRDREKRVLWQLSSKYGKSTDEVHILRVKPMENDKFIGMVSKPEKIVIKNNNYEDIMTVVNSKVSKRLLGMSSPLTPDGDKRSYSRKIDPKNYSKYKSPEKRTFNTLLDDSSVKMSKISIDFEKSKTFKKMSKNINTVLDSSNKKSPTTDISELLDRKLNF